MAGHHGYVWRPLSVRGRGAGQGLATQPQRTVECRRGGGPMTRLYRIADGHRIVHAIMRGEELVEIEGDVFGEYRLGAFIPGGLDRFRVLAPVMPSKIVC